MQVRLQQRWGSVRGAAVTGLLFALGHASLVLGAGDDVGVMFATLALLVAVSVPFRFLRGWVLTRTGSLFAVDLVHASGNATATGSVLGAGLLPRMYETDGAGGLVIPVLAVMGSSPWPSRGAVSVSPGRAPVANPHPSLTPEVHAQQTPLPRQDGTGERFTLARLLRQLRGCAR